MGRFEALLAGHWGILRRVAAAYGRGPADREDLQQEIALAAWRSWGRFDGERPFAAWLYRIAINVAISHLRRQGQGRALTLEQAPLGSLEAREASPGEGADRSERWMGLLAQLPAMDRALMVLWLEDQSYRQIAEVLGITETNVATRLSRIKQVLRERARGWSSSG